MLWSIAFSLIPLVSLPTVKGVPTTDCPILGPAFPSNFDLSTTEAFLDVADSFPQQIEALFESGAINETETSFVIDVFSTVTNTSIYSYYHSGRVNEEFLTGGELNDTTIFRVGSVSKLITAYAILAHSGLGVFAEPIINYLPELAGNPRNASINRIIWEDITVGAVAAHQAGTGGFPIQFQTCWQEDRESCNTEEFLTYMRDVNPAVMPAFQTVLYSDGGYGILGRVLERLSELPYADAIRTILSEPLGLNGTTAYIPESNANGLAFPGNASTWGNDNQVTAPSGGIYSNAADLRAIGISILNSQLLDSATTRAWMKPLANTATLTTSVGAPWEINRLNIPVSVNSTRTRVSDLYTKLGGNPPYAAVFALSPDHSIGYSILVAPDVRIPLRDAVGAAFIPAAEHAAQANAARNIVGTFVDETRNGTNITLTVNEDAPGIGVESFYYDGVEATTLFLTPTSTLPPANVSVRLYPVGGVEGSPGAQLRAFRSIATVLPAEYRADVEGGPTLFDACQSWFNVDYFTSLDGYGLDEFLLEFVDGRVESVTLRSFELSLTRVE